MNNLDIRQGGIPQSQRNEGFENWARVSAAEDGQTLTKPLKLTGDKKAKSETDQGYRRD
jgi:hypothetical protein